MFLRRIMRLLELKTEIILYAWHMNNLDLTIGALKITCPIFYIL
jgi:hypothetical protein